MHSNACVLQWCRMVCVLQPLYPPTRLTCLGSVCHGVSLSWLDECHCNNRHISRGDMQNAFECSHYQNKYDHKESVIFNAMIAQSLSLHTMKSKWSRQELQKYHLNDGSLHITQDVVQSSVTLSPVQHVRLISGPITLSTAKTCDEVGIPWNKLATCRDLESSLCVRMCEDSWCADVARECQSIESERNVWMHITVPKNVRQWCQSSTHTMIGKRFPRHFDKTNAAELDLYYDLQTRH